MRKLHLFVEPSYTRGVLTFLLWAPLLPEVWRLTHGGGEGLLADSFSSLFVVGPLYQALAQVVVYLHFPPFLLFDEFEFFSPVVIALLVLALFWSYVFATLLTIGTRWAFAHAGVKRA